MVLMTATILRRAAALIAERGWAPPGPFAEGFEELGIGRALMVAAFNGAESRLHAIRAESAAFRAVRVAIGEEYIAGWEYQEDRTKEDVLAVLERAAEKAEEGT